jgi:type IV secretion system protein VirB10
MTDIAEEFAPEEPVRRVPHIEGERAISPVAGRFAVARGGKAITLAALVLGGGIFLAATWDRNGKAKAEPEQPPARQVVPYDGPKPPPTLASAATDPSAPSLTGSPAIDPDGKPLTPEGAAGAPGSAGGTTEAQKRAALAEAARRSPLIAYSVNGGGGAPATTSEPGGPALVRAETSTGGTELDQLRQGSRIGEARAGRLPDRNFLIVAGANIPCVLQTAMDTSTPGYVTCVVPKDVYSDNGSVVLMEKGTRVLGEYHSGLRQGQKRLFVLWDRAVTPSGVAINVVSPASDSLGRAGFDGDIDTHFWARFGGALMLSIVDDGIAAAAGGNDRYPNVVQLPSDAAGIALQNSINISPTLRKPQGSEVSILVAQDLNFAGVYGLKPR